MCFVFGVFRRSCGDSSNVFHVGGRCRRSAESNVVTRATIILSVDSTTLDDNERRAVCRFKLPNTEQVTAVGVRDSSVSHRLYVHIYLVFVYRANLFDSLFFLCVVRCMNHIVLFYLIVCVIVFFCFCWFFINNNFVNSATTRQQCS